ncbi:MAG TPA: hypothetical protein VL383_02990, partial [Gemmatimonadaceae bacterium]|nr:hypothetical protein [Gemmatimonadaceae bacterium]
MKNRTRTGIFPVLCRLGRIAAAFAAVALSAGSRPLAAQFTVRSWLAWRTIETRHFAFHYPV